MIRETFCNNVKNLCSANEFLFSRDEFSFTIKTDFESFIFKLVGQNVWLTENRVRGAGNYPAKMLNILLMDPKPKDVVEAVINNIHIKTDAQYATWYFEKVREECRMYDTSCDMRFDVIFLKNNAEEFYIKFDVSNHDNIILMHRGKIGNGRMRGKTSYEYHRQFKRSISPRNIVKYIQEHTKYKYGAVSN